MVRQLGIEQQVILQPAAPVAMRNKAVLCRPLSVSRKTQACINSRNVECQFSADEEALASKHDEDIEEDEMMVVEEEPSAPAKKDIEDDADLIGEVDDEEVLSEKNESDVEIENKKPSTQCEAGANTEILSTSHLGTQTDETLKSESKTEEVKVEIKYVPIPIPVPIYVPVPVFTWARPVPFVLPLPLPCGIPLPLLLPGDKGPTEETLPKSGDEEKEKNTDQEIELKTPLTVGWPVLWSLGT